MAVIADQLRGNPPREWKPRPEVLLDPPLPAPMHGLAPRIVLGQQWWDAVRFEAYRSTNYHCVACGQVRSDGWAQLEGHERYDVDYLLGRMTYVETVPLCRQCHAFVHRGYLRVQLEQGIIQVWEYEAVVDHCRLVLDRAGLRAPEPHRGPTADWADWRLVIDGVEYPPLHGSHEMYREALDDRAGH